jgi:hypothetical protein
MNLSDGSRPEITIYSISYLQWPVIICTNTQATRFRILHTISLRAMRTSEEELVLEEYSGGP